MAGFWWWGNVFMAMWASVTIVAGIRYADGKAINGPIAFIGRVFDSLFGLDTCRKIPGRNQNLHDLKNPCYLCSKGAAYPHAAQPGFVVNHSDIPNMANCTGVLGVGGVRSDHITGGGKGPVDPVTYITTVLTGHPAGSVAKGEYDKKRFKHGTPYAQYQTGDTFGYYYSTDAKNQEVPLIAPATSTKNSVPIALREAPLTYGGTAATEYMPPGANNWLRYDGTNVGMVYTGLSGGGPTYANPTHSTFDPLLGFVGTGVSSAQANIDFIQGPLSSIENLQYKTFSPVSAKKSAHPSEWATR